MEKEFDIIEWSIADSLRNDNRAILIDTFDFNLAHLYNLNKDYIVMPLSPFGKALIASDYKIIKKWLTNEYFPTNEKINEFYFSNKRVIDRISQNKDALILDLEEFLGKKDLLNLSSKEIDEVYALLKKKRKFEKYKLNFIFLVGEKLIELNRNELSWGTVRNIQLLNPIVQLVLIKREKDNNENRYFELEYAIVGKWGYLGMDNIIQDFKRSFKTPNEFSRVIKSL